MFSLKERNVISQTFFQFVFEIIVLLLKLTLFIKSFLDTHFVIFLHFFVLYLITSDHVRSNTFRCLQIFSELLRILVYMGYISLTHQRLVMIIAV